MKKGKVLGKGQIAVGLMVVALAAAVWLNTKYMPSSTKYLGEASYVSNTQEDKNAVETAAKPQEKADYFETAKKEREAAREEACELIEETLKSRCYGWFSLCLFIQLYISSLLTNFMGLYKWRLYWRYLLL